MWQKHLVDDYGAEPPTQWFSSTPVVWGDRLIVNAGAHGMAIDKNSGDLIWGEGGLGCYATVSLWPESSPERALIFGPYALQCVDLDSGELVWSFPFFTVDDVNAVDPLVIGDRVFVTSQTGCALLRISGDTYEVLWQNQNLTSCFSSCVQIGGHIYGSHVIEVLHESRYRCLDMETGEIAWTVDHGFTGAIIAAGGKLIMVTAKGAVRIAEAEATEYRELVAADVPDRAGDLWNSPAFSHGRLYVISTVGRIHCIDMR
jgi:outer membrane protein assembly factor BamB